MLSTATPFAMSLAPDNWRPPDKLNRRGSVPASQRMDQGRWQRRRRPEDRPGNIWSRSSATRLRLLAFGPSRLCPQHKPYPRKRDGISGAIGWNDRRVNDRGTRGVELSYKCSDITSPGELPIWGNRKIGRKGRSGHECVTETVQCQCHRICHKAAGEQSGVDELAAVRAHFDYPRRSTIARERTGHLPCRRYSPRA